MAGFGGDAATGGGGGGGITIDAGDASAPGAQVVYAHTDTTLFSLDPKATTLSLKQLGDFDCIGGTGIDTSMTDVAVDKDGNLWGISASAVMPLAVVNKSVHCGTPIVLSKSDSVRFYALTFAPVGVLDASKEVLVAGNTAGELWAIDSQGGLTLLGNFGTVPSNDGNGHTFQYPGTKWELSGDVVFLANGGNPVGFATVRDCQNPPSDQNCSDDDTLIEIDVPKLSTKIGGAVTKAVRGKIVKRAGCTDDVAGSYDNMYGIGAWGEKVYGFSRAGYLVDVDLVDGSGCLVKQYNGAKFSGACCHHHRADRAPASQVIDVMHRVKLARRAKT